MSRQQAPTLTSKTMQRMIIIQHHKHGLECADLIHLFCVEFIANISLEGEE